MRRRQSSDRITMAIRAVRRPAATWPTPHPMQFNASVLYFIEPRASDRNRCSKVPNLPPSLMRSKLSSIFPDTRRLLRCLI